jgi:C4-dicarboxylate-specific signal transduction histidine kinase
VDQSSIRVFEIDMDSIFNNLIINSINAFNFSKINEQREIKIKVVENQKEIIISYYDNGPPLYIFLEKASSVQTHHCQDK